MLLNRLLTLTDKWLTCRSCSRISSVGSAKGATPTLDFTTGTSSVVKAPTSAGPSTGGLVGEGGVTKARSMESDISRHFSTGSVISWSSAFLRCLLKSPHSTWAGVACVRATTHTSVKDPV